RCCVVRWSPAVAPSSTSGGPAQDDDAASLYRHLVTGLGVVALVHEADVRVQVADPCLAEVGGRDGEVQGLLVGVEEQEEAVVHHGLASGIGRGDGLAVQ